MGSKSLKGLTIQIGADTSDLNKALDKVDKQSRNLSSELGQINKLLQLDPKNTELLAQKQKVLAEAIGATEEKLDTLREAEKQVQAQFEKGEVSEAQYRTLQREIIATEKRLDGYRKAAKETDDTVADLGKESKDTSEDIEDLGEAAKDAEKLTSGLGDALETGLAVGLGAVVAATGAAIAGIKSVVDETAEYRTAMGKLDTTFQSSEHSSEAATATYKELQSILGDTDQAVEAASFIAKLADNEADLVNWTNIATGVYGQFGASLPIEGLTEAANETAKVGKVTGPLADALNWAAKEGESFGVKLKENIEFTELSTKELSKLTDAQRKEYEARKAQHDAIAEYNQKVEEAASAEDLFNIALENCTTEQERQTLIMDTLNSMYADTADQYREANKEIIDQNKAIERLNAAWAKVGEKAAPIVSTFTEGVADLVEVFFELVEDVDIEPFLKKTNAGFKKFSSDVLPKVVKSLEWCIDNFDTIKSVAIGFITALAFKKVTTFANSLRNDLVIALGKATTGFKAMDAAAKANVYIALASAIIGVATAIGSYFLQQAKKKQEAIKENTLAAYGMSEAELEMAERVKDTADAYRDQRKAVDESIAATMSQFGYLGSLKDELFKLADAQGKVAEQDQARAQFIIGELKDKLGIEITMVDGVIQGYKDLKVSIEEAMAAKKTELLLADAQQGYVDAIKNKTQAEKDYYTSVMAYQDAKIQKDRIDQELAEHLASARLTANAAEQIAFAQRTGELEAQQEALNKTLTDAESAYINSRTVLEGYYADIGQYETAQQLSLEGKTAEAAKVLADRGYYMEQYAEKVGFESKEIMNSWELEATTAGIEAKNVKKNWENGVAGYTEEMVAEAEKGYKETLGAMNGAYDDAYKVGSDMSDGMAEGLESGRLSVVGKIRQIIAEAIEAARRESDSHSPSRKMEKVTIDMGKGAEIGLIETTDDVIKASANQARSIIDTYDSILTHDGQRALRQLEAAEASGRSTAQMTAATANSEVLEQILQAIRDGQVILLDGEALVGGTTNRMDRNLGLLQVLSARGAT